MSVCYAYGRHSTHKQNETEQVQRQKCEEYFNRELAPKGVQWGGWFYDAANSAGKKRFSERAKGRQVFAVAQPGDHVLIAKIDRAFRSLIDGKSVADQFHKRGVFFHALDYRIDTSTAQGRYVLSIFLAGAELELEMARERAIDMIEYRRRNGIAYTRYPPMGWRFAVSAGVKTYRINMEERDFIEKLADMISQGASMNELAFYGWNNAKTLGMSRPFDSPYAIKWALQARDLGYPKVCGAKVIRKMHSEWRKSGQITDGLSEQAYG